MKQLTDFLIAERTVVTVIVLNAIALFAMASTVEQDSTTTVWFIIDYCCVVYFILESGIKIGKLGWSKYWSEGWNRFDFIIVAVSLPVLLAPWIDLHQLATILLLRLGRLFRLFRLMLFIPNAQHLAMGIKRALKASVGVFIGLFLVNLIFAIGATMLFRDLSPDYFANPLMSLYSTFRVLTVEGWYEIPDTIAAAAGSDGWALAARVYFIITLLIGGILGLSLANAVFVDEMTMDNTADLESKVDRIADEITALREEIQSIVRENGKES